MIHAKYGVVIG